MNLNLNGDFWHHDDNTGFTLKKVQDLGEIAFASIIKLRGLFDFLSVDPHCSDGERKRAFLIAVAIAENGGYYIQKTTDLIHCQSENTEFPGLQRKLPEIPFQEQFWPELKQYIEVVLHACGREESDRPIQIKCHLLRLHATQEHSGRATPNRPHKDNTEQVVITLLSRVNVTGGENSLFSNQGHYVGSFTLDPLEVCFLNDRRFYHHVEEVRIEGDSSFGYRDSLIFEIKSL